MGTLVAGSIGTALGILSGYVALVDQIIMRLTGRLARAAGDRLRDLPGRHVRASIVEHHRDLGSVTGRATRASIAARC